MAKDRKTKGRAPRRVTGVIKAQRLGGDAERVAEAAGGDTGRAGPAQIPDQKIREEDLLELDRQPRVDNKSARADIAAAKDRFCLALRHKRAVTYALRFARVARSVAYEWKREDHTFSARWDEAWDGVIDDLEQSFLARAIDGYTRPIYQGGKLAGFEQVHHPVQGIFMLKAHRRAMYGDLTNGSQLPPEDYARRVREAFDKQDEEAKAALAKDKAREKKQ